MERFSRLAKGEAMRGATIRRIAARALNGPTYAQVVSPRHDTARLPPQTRHEEQGTRNSSNEGVNGAQPPPAVKATLQDNNWETPADPSKPEDGWTLVQRKQRSPKPKTFLTRHQQTLQDEKKCFKCLQKGHWKIHCTNEIRCLKCSKFGHLSKFCHNHRINNGVNERRSTNQPIKPTHNHIPTHAPLPSLPKTLPKNTATPPNPPKLKAKQDNLATMDPLLNWEDLTYTNPNYWQGEPADELEAFLPERVQLLPGNTFLERSAIVMTGPNQADAVLAQRLTLRLASCFRTTPRAIKVTKINPNTGDMLAEFPTVDMRNQAVQICVFSLGRDMEVQLARWTHEAGTVYDPASTYAKIRLHGMPYQNWDRESVEIAVAGFGRLERVAPFFANGNYEYIRALVDCRHVMKIPPRVTTYIGRRSITVEIVLEGWLHSSEIFPRENNMGGDDGIDHHFVNNLPPRGRTTETRDRPTNRRNRSVDSYNRRSSQNNRGRRHASTPVQDNDSKSQGEIPVQKEVPVLEDWRNMPIVLIPSPQKPTTGENGSNGGKIPTSEPVQTTGEMIPTGEVPINGGKPQKKGHQERGKEMNFVFSLEFGHAAVRVYGRIKCDGTRGELFKKFSAAPCPEVTHTGILLSDNNKKNKEFASLGEGLIGTHQLKIAEDPVQQTLEENTREFAILERGNGGPEITGLNSDKIILDEGNGSPSEEDGSPPEENENLNDESENSDEDMDGPPPGFDKPLFCARRSVRIQERTQGEYVDPEERARLVTKPNSVSLARKPNRKRAKPSPIRLEYLESLDPLTAGQAEAVTSAAGIKPGGRIDAAIAQVIGV